MHLVAINKILSNRSYYDEDWTVYKRPKNGLGEESATPKLTREIVDWVRREYITGKYMVSDIQQMLFDKYNIEYKSLTPILRNLQWIDKDYNPDKNKVTSEIVKFVRDEYIKNKPSYTTLGQLVTSRFGEITNLNIGKIVRNDRWFDEEYQKQLQALK